MKRTAFVKALSLVLCLLMLVAVFAACDDKGKTAITTPATTTTTTPVGGGEGGGEGGSGRPIVSSLGVIPEDVDYGGDTYKLLLWTEAKKGIFPEAQVDGTNIVNDLYERNRLIEQELGLKYDVTYKESSSSGTGVELYNHALAGKVAYEAICCYSTYPPKLALEGMLTDLNTLEYPATEMQWYPSQVHNWEIKDRLFFVTNNSSIRNIIANWCIYANNVMIEDKGLEEIADVVLDGRWTLDVLKTYSRNWAVDAEGNASKEESEKVYGLALVHSTSIEAFYHAAGFQATGRDSEGEPTILFTRASNIEEVSRFVDTFIDICNSPEFGYADQDETTSAKLGSGNWTNPLKNENAAFYVGALDMYNQVDAESGKFTIIPLPKLNEAQTEYHSITNWAFDVWCVPTNATDPDVGALTIEAMSYDDFNSIAHKFWDKDFKYRYSSDDRGVQIFDLIRLSFYADFARAWSVGSPYELLKSCLVSSGEMDLENSYALTAPGNLSSSMLALNDLNRKLEALFPDA